MLIQGVDGNIDNILTRDIVTPEDMDYEVWYRSEIWQAKNSIGFWSIKQLYSSVFYICNLLLS